MIHKVFKDTYLQSVLGSIKLIFGSDHAMSGSYYF